MALCNDKDKQPGRWRRRKAARPEEILQAALQLFSEKGYAATRMTDVARQAGISKGTLYLYFDSKDAIFRNLVQEMITPELERTEALLESYQGASDALLREMILSWWAFIGASKLSAIPKLMVSESGNFPELAQFFVDKVVKRARKLYASVISRGIARGEFRPHNPDAVARLVIAPMVQLVIWMHSLQPYDDPVDPEEYLNLHIAFLLNRLVKPSGPDGDTNDHNG